MRKYIAAIKPLEQRILALEDQNANVCAKNERLLLQLQNQERDNLHRENEYGRQISQLKLSGGDAQNQVENMNNLREKFRTELQLRDTHI